MRSYVTNADGSDCEGRNITMQESIVKHIPDFRETENSRICAASGRCETQFRSQQAIRQSSHKSAPRRQNAESVGQEADPWYLRYESRCAIEFSSPNHLC